MFILFIKSLPVKAICLTILLKLKKFINMAESAYLDTLIPQTFM